MAFDGDIVYDIDIAYGDYVYIVKFLYLFMLLEEGLLGFTYFCLFTYSLTLYNYTSSSSISFYFYYFYYFSLVILLFFELRLAFNNKFYLSN